MDTKTKLPEEKGYMESKGVKRAFDFTEPGAVPTADNLPQEFKDKYAHKLVIRDDRIKLSGDGVFYTVQGEGITTGLPAVFMRLQFCNLMCTWCDAFYTWNRDVEEFWKESEDITFEEGKKRLEEAWGCERQDIKRVVFTGGEPLLQRKQLDQLIDLIPDWQIEFETNGTIMPTEKMMKLAEDKLSIEINGDSEQALIYQKARIQFNCSPKLKHSKNVDKLRIRPEVLQAMNKVNTTFKFVVMSPEDLDEIENDFVKPYGLDPNKVAVMPQGVSVEEIDMNLANVAEAVKKKGYRVFTRLHVQIWGGAKRRV